MTAPAVQDLPPAPARPAQGVRRSDAGAGGPGGVAEPEGRASVVARVLWSVLVLGVSALAIAPAYAGATAVLAGAVAFPVALVSAGAAARLPRWSVAVAVVSVGVGLALTAAGRSAPDAPVVPSWRASPVLEMLGPLIDAVPRLLTSPRPAPATPEALAPTALLVWIVASVVALVVVPQRAGARRARRPAVLAPLVGAAVLQVAGALLTAGGSDRYGVLAASTMLLVGTGWVVWGRGSSFGGALGGVAVAVLAASCALVAGSVSTTGAFEPRRLVTPPVLVSEAANPVPLVRAWAGRSDLELFTVSAQGAGPLPDRLTLVPLNAFDGAVWRAEPRLRALGVVEEPDLPPGDRRGEVVLRVELGDLGGPWVPSAGRPTAVDGGPVLADVDSGAILVGEWPGAGGSYEVVAQVDAPTPTEVARAGTPAGDLVEKYLSTPRLPEALADEARAVTAGSASRLEQAERIVEAVRGDRTVTAGAPGGSSYARIQELLFEDSDGPEARGGTSEQFASAFAVLARSVGLPTRVVVGFVLPEPGPDGLVTITAADAAIWPEVYFSRVGWVAFDPTPSEVEEGAPPPDPAPGSEAVEPGAEAEPDGDLDAPVDEGADPGAGSPDVAGIARGAGVVAAALLVTSLLGLCAWRAGRRLRQRRRGSLGAWQLVLDALALAGTPADPARTATQVADALDARRGGSGARTVADAAERTAYAPAGAGGAGVLAPRHEDPAAWAAAVEVAARLRTQASRARRLVWWVSPRVLSAPRRPGR